MVIKKLKRDDNTKTVTSAAGNHHTRKILTPDRITEVAESGGWKILISHVQLNSKDVRTVN